MTGPRRRVSRPKPVVLSSHVRLVEARLGTAAADDFESHCVRLRVDPAEQAARIITGWLRQQRALERRRQAGGAHG
jgi:hypothetical protein